MRGPLRTRTLDLLRSALLTDDGRQILAEAMRGLVPTFPVAGVPTDRHVDDYPELGSSNEPKVHAGPAPVFITGRFRSGSTLLWNVFRHVEGCRAYYEPLNERRWFDPARRGSRVDATHIGVSDYWREYEGLAHLGHVFRDDWATRHLHMDEGSWDSDLVDYIGRLIEAAGPARAVLQFNRVDFRLPWLKRWFPQAVIVHVYRHPREQWCSTLVDATRFPKDARLAEFEAHDHYYLLAWARDLRHRFPFLDERGFEHPYELFYLIWKLSWLYGRTYAAHSVGLERFTASPRVELRSMLDAIGLAGVAIEPLERLVVHQAAGKWRQYADHAWFVDHESRCEARLDAWIGRASWRVEDPDPAG